MPSLLAHDWFRPRLEALLAEADKAGYARDVSQAAITDLANGTLAAAAPVEVPDDNWAQDIGEPASAAAEMPPTRGLPPQTGGNDPRGDFPRHFDGRVRI